MSYSGESNIVGNGESTGEQITGWFRRYGYAPEGIGEQIIRAATKFAPHGHVVNHDILAAIGAKESAYHTSMIFRLKNNPTGFGATNDDPLGNAITFETPYHGYVATAAHLLMYAVGDGPWREFDPRADAPPRNWIGTTKRLVDLNGRYAWPGTSYGQGVARVANTLISHSGGPIGAPNSDYGIFISPGHFNSSGGNALEKEIVGPLSIAIKNELERRKFRVVMLQGEDGHGSLRDYPGTHNDVAREAIRIRNEADSPRWNLYLAVHAEGTSDPNVRGPFGIYPHNDDRMDLDRDVRDALGPDMATRLANRFGMPLRTLSPPGGPGIMSEKQTHVRELGEFRNTASLKAEAERMFVEVGSFTNPTDLAIMRRPDYAGLAASEIVDAIDAFYTGSVERPVEPVKTTTAISVPVGHPYHPVMEVPDEFYEFWESHGGLSIFGWPWEPFRVDNQMLIQDFERARFELHPWGIGLGLVNVERLAMRQVLTNIDDQIDTVRGIL